MEIALYYAPITCAMVPYISLTEVGAAFEVRKLDFRKMQHMSPQYMALNPKHKVPLLVVDGKTLTENVAINLFIARSFPAAKLLPTDPWAEAQAVSLMSWCSAGIHPFLRNINGPPKVCDVPGTEASIVRLSSAMLHESFAILEAKLAGHEYFFDHFTVPDAYFFWCYRRAEQLGVDLSKYANCNAHHARMKERPSVAKLLAFEAETQAAFANAA
ncbi:unnamed protein product [Phaeothamnion confervicola]